MKWLKRTGLSFLILFVLSSLGLFFYLQTFKPSYSGEIKLPGLQDSTVVYFDAFGVPHVYGKTEKDVFHALGYIHAKERLFQMELIRRVSAGRLSELFGSSVLDVDRFFRMLGIGEKAKQSALEFEKFKGGKMHTAAIAYLDGLNEYLENGKMPIEFGLLNIPKEKYEVEDLYLIVSYVSFNFNMAFRTDPLLDRIRKKWGINYLHDLGFESALSDSSKINYTEAASRNSETALLAGFESIQEKLPLQAWTGSNSIVISAQKSSSGKVLFENDTHIGHQQPSVWYESHLEYPGFRFYGSWVAGFPFAALGHSERHAWGLTIFENDDLDFFAEKINPDNPDQVWEKDHWADMDIRLETIKIKDSTDVKIRCRATNHGPVCSDVMKDFTDFGVNPVSACWTFLREPNNMVQVTYDMAHSKSMEDFKEAASALNAPGLNVLYADNENNIAWWAAAKIVKRPEGVDPSFVLDGSSGKDDWTGYYAFEFNPASVNPPSGFVFSSNQKPNSVEGVIYPGYYLPNDRADHLRAILTSQSMFSLSDLQTFNLNILNPVSAAVNQELLRKLNLQQFSNGSDEKKLLNILQAWDGSHGITEIAPSFYYRWYYYVYQKTFSDELGAQDADAFLKTHIQKMSLLPWMRNDSTPWWDDVTTPDLIETSSEIINTSFLLAYKDMKAQLGKDPLNWTWGKLHTLELEHPVGKQWPMNYLFNVGPYPISGGIETLNNQSFLFSSELVFKSNLGAALRRTIDFADPENGMSIVPGGQSGNPMSPHYSDQTELYVNGELRKEMMNKDDIQKGSKNKLLFLPATKTQ